MVKTVYKTKIREIYDNFKLKPGPMRKVRNTEDRFLRAGFRFMVNSIVANGSSNPLYTTRPHYYKSQQSIIKARYVYNEYRDHYFQDEFKEQYAAQMAYLGRKGAQNEHPILEKEEILELCENNEEMLQELVENNILKSISENEFQVKGNVEKRKKKIAKITGESFEKVFEYLTINQGKFGQGFNEISNNVNLVSFGRMCQNAGDEYIWKIIISPERGADVDLKEHTRELVKIIEKDLGTKLQWVAIDHYNTLKFHVHLVVRGLRDDGSALRLTREYWTVGMRERSKQLMTQKLGLRTHLDILESRQKNLTVRHVTDMDKEIESRLTIDHHFNLKWSTNSSLIYKRNLQIQKRLGYLNTIGLAKELTSTTWQVDPTFIKFLRFIQQKDDIIKSMNKHITQVIDKDLEVVVSTLPNVGDSIIGRVVGSGLSELNEESRYLFVEGIDGKIHSVRPSGKALRLLDNQKLSEGQYIHLKRSKFVKDAQEIPWVEAHVYKDFESVRNTTEITSLDRYIATNVINNGYIPEAGPTANTIRKEFMKIVQARTNYMQRLGILSINNGRYELDLFKLEQETRLKRKVE